VQGSPLVEKSYDRVNLMRAKQVVILTPNISLEMAENRIRADQDGGEEGTENARKDASEDENLLDAKTIFKYNIIKKKNP
jgi:hypothetical protein